MMKKLLTMLLCVVLIGCVTEKAFADGGVSLRLEASKTEVKAGDTVEYTVYLCGADTLDGGVWAYEFVLEIPEGLSFVSGSGNVSSAAIKGFIKPVFNENAKKCTSGMGAIGEGFTGARLPLLTFQCKVESAAADKLTISLVKTLVGNREGKRTEHTAVNETISLHAHVGAEPTFRWGEGDTCAVVYCCTVDGCGEEVVKEAVVTVQATDATCKKAGKVTYTAVFEMNGTSYTDTKVVESGTVPHEYTAEFRWSEDCSSVDVTLRCSNCGETVEVDAEDVVVSVKTAEDGRDAIYEASVTLDGHEYTASETGKQPDVDPEVLGGVPEEPVTEKKPGRTVAICAVAVIALALVAVVVFKNKKAKDR